MKDQAQGGEYVLGVEPAVFIDDLLALVEKYPNVFNPPPREEAAGTSAARPPLRGIRGQ